LYIKVVYNFKVVYKGCKYNHIDTLAVYKKVVNTGKTSEHLQELVLFSNVDVMAWLKIKKYKDSAHPRNTNRGLLFPRSQDQMLSWDSPP